MLAAQSVNLVPMHYMGTNRAECNASDDATLFCLKTPILSEQKQAFSSQPPFH